MTTRRTYLPVRIDFAPFVGVALLLIVFFVFTKAIQRPEIMGVTVPTGCRKYESPTSPKKVVTLFLLDKGSIGFMQHWQGDDMVELGRTDCRPEAIREFLKTAGKAMTGDVAVVIKPTPSATFGTVEIILRELKRTGTLPYLPFPELSGHEQLIVNYYECVLMRNPSIRDTTFLQLQPYYR